MLEQFANLFKGSMLAHGTWDKSTGNMITLHSAPTLDDYRKHLDGELGLGVYAANEEGKCIWGAIDVDIDTIDHKELYARVLSRGLPLTVCRSKSGGAHLYVFFKEPYQASAVQVLLKKWAALLGFPSKTEIFPKQTRAVASNLGNWLNLPYFNAKNTVRYAVNGDGSLSFEEFLSSIKFYTGNEKINENITSDLVQIDQMPPCLREL